MKKLTIILAIFGIAFISISSIDNTENDLKSTFTFGDPEISSIDKMSFGPEGILFIGDSKNATIYAIDTKDNTINKKPDEILLEGVDSKIAASLGISIENISISDMVVNPNSKSVYFSVNTIDGTPVLLKLAGNQFENISLKKASYSKFNLTDAVATDKKDRRGRALRVWAISDLMYHDGTVMVSGLSNKEFSSTFRNISFPFDDKQDFASLEIYHAAHGRYETYAPIKSFNVINIDGKDQLIASYTCTPLVLFPLDKLKGNNHIKGRTIAELGAGNSPVDIISFDKKGVKYYLISNTNRGVMRITHEDVANSKESLTEPVEEFAVSSGLEYVTLPFVNVVQMDNLDDTHVLLLKRDSNGQLVLRTRTTEWM